MYIIDTGIEIAHSDFGGRAAMLSDHVGNSRNGFDCNGHGTHVAGTAGGGQRGVAKAVNLKAVRVLNGLGSGSNSGVIDGIDVVTADDLPGQPDVATMSLGGDLSQALNNAVTNSVNDGVTYALAAGKGDFLSRVDRHGRNFARAQEPTDGLICIEMSRPAAVFLWVCTSDTPTTSTIGCCDVTPNFDPLVLSVSDLNV